MNRIVATKRGVPAYRAFEGRKIADVPMSKWCAERHKPQPEPFWRRLFGGSAHRG